MFVSSRPGRLVELSRSQDWNSRRSCVSIWGVPHITSPPHIFSRFSTPSTRFSYAYIQHIVPYSIRNHFLPRLETGRSRICSIVKSTSYPTHRAGITAFSPYILALGLALSSLLLLKHRADVLSNSLFTLQLCIVFVAPATLLVHLPSRCGSFYSQMAVTEKVVSRARGSVVGARCPHRRRRRSRSGALAIERAHHADHGTLQPPRLVTLLSSVDVVLHHHPLETPYSCHSTPPLLHRYRHIHGPRAKGELYQQRPEAARPRIPNPLLTAPHRLRSHPLLSHRHPHCIHMSRLVAFCLHHTAPPHQPHQSSIDTSDHVFASVTHGLAV